MLVGARAHLSPGFLERILGDARQIQRSLAPAGQSAATVTMVRAFLDKPI
jgi:hypothetical protein